MARTVRTSPDGRKLIDESSYVYCLDYKIIHVTYWKCTVLQYKPRVKISHNTEQDKFSSELQVVHFNQYTQSFLIEVSLY